MRILVTGATGYVGSRLSETLQQAGHTVVALSRDPERARRGVPALGEAFPWLPAQGPPPPEAFRGVEGVVHLAGESLEGRWTAAKKRAIHDSRVVGTRHLVAGMEAGESRPRVLVSVSAVGYYGDRGEEVLTEESAPGEGFMARVCQGWEGEAARAEDLGARVVRLRNGLVLGPGSRVTARLLPLFRLGLGGPLGSGRQWWPWVHVEDVVALMQEALEGDMSGVVNGVAPEAVRQRDFARALGRVVRRPAVVPVPALVLRVVLGEMASSLLDSLHVVPQRLQGMGYGFRYPNLEPALRSSVG